MEWTLSEDDYIEKYYLVKSDEELAKDLSKITSQVKKRRYDLGFTKQRQTPNRGTRKEGEKWCWYCAEYHKISEFNKNKRKEDGLQDECKRANKEINLKRKAKISKKKGNDILEKKCLKCDEVKSINNFIKNISTSDGYSKFCKQCLNENKTSRKYKMEDNSNE